MWEIAEPGDKKFKIFLEGPPGCFKTRLALRLADNGNRAEPAAGVIDTEHGTDHYAGDFAFRRQQTHDPEKIYKEVEKLVKNPGNIKTLILDTFSVYYDSLMELWVDRFQLREKNSAGNKGEYYKLQPLDYVQINRDAGKLVRMLLECDLNIICVCQIKDQWEGMKVVGSVFDGWKRLPYYFDTRIAIDVDPKQKNSWKAVVKGKDRSHSFEPGEVIPWKSDEAIVQYMVKRMGQDLSGGKAANAYTPDHKSQVEVQPAEAKKAADTKAEEKAPATATVTDSKAETANEAEKAKAAEPETPAKTVETDDAGKEDTTPVTQEKLVEIVRAKKAAKINDPAVWGKLLEKYQVETAKAMNMSQADELIKDLIRGDIPT